jgi:hypothetical protein
MKCLKYQTENPEAKKLCRECGAKLLLACPQCSAEVLPGDKFCGECAYDLRKPKEIPPIDYSQPPKTFPLKRN